MSGVFSSGVHCTTPGSPWSQTRLKVRWYAPKEANSSAGGWSGSGVQLHSLPTPVGTYSPALFCVIPANTCTFCEEENTRFLRQEKFMGSRGQAEGKLNELPLFLRPFCRGNLQRGRPLCRTDGTWPEFRDLSRPRRRRCRSGRGRRLFRELADRWYTKKFPSQRDL